MIALPLTLPSAAGLPKMWGPQYERCPISINDRFCRTLLFGTDIPGQRCQKEGSLKATWETSKHVGKDMPAVGSGALKNAKVSIASNVSMMMLMNWRQIFGPVQHRLAIDLAGTDESLATLSTSKRSIARITADGRVVSAKDGSPILSTVSKLSESISENIFQFPTKFQRTPPSLLDAYSTYANHSSWRSWFGMCFHCIFSLSFVKMLIIIMIIFADTGSYSHSLSIEQAGTWSNTLLHLALLLITACARKSWTKSWDQKSILQITLICWLWQPSSCSISCTVKRESTTQIRCRRHFLQGTALPKSPRWS